MGHKHGHSHDGKNTTSNNPDEANLSRGDAAIQMESYLKLYGK